MRQLTQEEILAAFSKKEKGRIKLPDVSLIDWENLDFLGWIHPSSHLGYVIYEFSFSLRGIFLERNIKTFGSGVRMCSWCYTLHTTSGVKLFTYKIPRTKITIGDYICADLQWSLYLRGVKKPEITQMPETLSLQEKIERCKKNIEKFFLIIGENAK